MPTDFEPRPLLAELAGTPVPRLWCPPLTHYTADGALDRARMAAHREFLDGHVGGYLVPGSTGDAWEMDPAGIAELLGFSLDMAASRPERLLLGALRPDAATTLETITGMLASLCRHTGRADPHEAMTAAGVCAFTVCPPTGQGLSQAELAAGLEDVLVTGLPVALYQLPQVTRNEMDPGLVERLAARHANLVFFKDSSGGDRVAAGAADLGGVFMTRGAEGGYAGWLREGGGPYHGWLLSTANCFARELDRILADLEGGRVAAAVALSDRLTGVVERVFALVADLPDGNAFANANKAMDHFMAHGPGAVDEAPPRLHAGSRLPRGIIARTGEILSAAGLLPERGYLDP